MQSPALNYNADRDPGMHVDLTCRISVKDANLMIFPMQSHDPTPAHLHTLHVSICNAMHSMHKNNSHNFLLENLLFPLYIRMH